MMYWFDMDTFVLAIATMVVLIILWGWHTDYQTKFDMKEVLTDSRTGRVSLMKIGQFTALLVSTWVLIHETRAGKLSEALFLCYMGAWAGANIVNKWVTKPSEKVGADRGANDREQ